MSEQVVLDASALLALIKGEPGAELVAATLPEAVISAVNYAEVLSKLSDEGWPSEEAIAAIRSLGPDVVDLTAAHAECAGRLRQPSRKIGLSLGDRACLGLAQTMGLRVLTADAAWLRIAEDTGLQITDIRSKAH